MGQAPLGKRGLWVKGGLWAWVVYRSMCPYVHTPGVEFSVPFQGCCLKRDIQVLIIIKMLK